MKGAGCEQETPDLLRRAFGFGLPPSHHFRGPCSYVEGETCQIPDSVLLLMPHWTMVVHDSGVEGWVGLACSIITKKLNPLN